MRETFDKIIASKSVLWEEFKKFFLKDNAFYIFWTTLFFYFFLFLNPNNKTLFLAFLVLILIYYFKLKNFRLALLVTTLASSIFIVGKTYVFELIPVQKLLLEDYPLGYNIGVTLTVSIIFSYLLLLVLLRDIIRKKIAKLSFDTSFWLLLFFYLAVVISSFIASKNYQISALYALGMLGIFIIFFFVRSYNFKNIFFIILALLSAMIIFEGTLSGLQYVSRSPLGRSIELRQDIEVFGRGADEDVFQYRPVGTFSHANELSAFLLPSLILVLASFYLKGNHLVYSSTAFVFGLVTLFLTLSRSAWFSFISTAFLLLFIIEKKWRFPLKFSNKVKRKLLLLALVVFILSLFIILPRISRSLYSFGESGGFYTRFELMKESWSLISRFPFFGVGLGLSPQLIFEQNPHGVMSYFPSVVHNAYLLMASETGLIALIFFLAYLVVLLKKSLTVLSIKNDYGKIVTIGAVFSISAVLFNWLLQPLYSTDLLLLIILTLILYETAKQT